MNIRRRLTVLYTLVLASLLLVFTFGIFLSFKYHLRLEVDESLAAWSMRLLESDGSGGFLIPASGNSEKAPPYGNLEMPDTFVVAFGPGGEIRINRSLFNATGVDVLRKTAELYARPVEPAFRNLAIDDQNYRVLLKKIPGSTGGDTFLLLGRSLYHVDVSIRGFATTLVLAWVVAVLICSSVMWVLVGQTLRPIHAMTARALAIAESSDLGRRIDAARGRDEFSELARALNKMLSSLQGSYEAGKQFLADVSHELRTPLTSIGTNLGFVLKASDASETEKTTALRDCVSETERMSSLVRQLLLLARTDAPLARSVARVDIAAIAAEAFGSLRNRAATDFGRLRLDIPELPLEIAGDRDELRLAIEMLLDNARKYSGAGGTVSLRASGVGARMEIEIRDDGPGIPSDELPKVLERFYRASNVRGKQPGSGLGLAIVKSIAQKHGGSIVLRNLEPKGLSVILSFPAAM